MGGVGDPERHRRRARPMLGDKIGAVGARRLVDEVIDVSLPIQRHRAGLMSRDRGKTHQAKEGMQLFGLGM
jgi:hypothetical protein